jgi:hypothetical protein
VLQKIARTSSIEVAHIRDAILHHVSFLSGKHQDNTGRNLQEAETRPP